MADIEQNSYGNELQEGANAPIPPTPRHTNLKHSFQDISNGDDEADVMYPKMSVAFIREMAVDVVKGNTDKLIQKMDGLIQKVDKLLELERASDEELAKQGEALEILERTNQDHDVEISNQALQFAEQSLALANVERNLTQLIYAKAENMNTKMARVNGQITDLDNTVTGMSTTITGLTTAADNLTTSSNEMAQQLNTIDSKLTDELKKVDNTLKKLDDGLKKTNDGLSSVTSSEESDSD